MNLRLDSFAGDSQRSRSEISRKVLVFFCVRTEEVVRPIALSPLPNSVSINIMNIEIIGFVAGALVAVSLLPQVIKSWKTKSAGDISVLWSIINLTGQVIWIVYGIVKSSPSLVIMSSIALVMMLSVFYLKLKYGLNKAG